jgi:signal peptidase I
MSEETTTVSETPENFAPEAVTQDPTGKTTSKKNAFWKELLSYIEIFAVAFVIAYILTHFLIINCKVPTGSMLDTIQLNDRIIGSRLSYINSSPERGDIVIFPFPDNESKIYIKRVIGLPGETIEVRDGRVYINGSDTPLEEPYLKDEYLIGSRDFGPYTIPEGSYFMLGDHRNNSADSRVWNNTCVQEDKIMGKALFIYYPFNHITWLDQDYDYITEIE